MKQFPFAINTIKELQDCVEQVREESRQMPRYDYIVINDDLGKACEELHTLIDGQHRRYALNREFAEQLQEDLYRRFKEE